jgi:hypothetical protein
MDRRNVTLQLAVTALLGTVLLSSCAVTPTTFTQVPASETDVANKPTITPARSPDLPAATMPEATMSASVTASPERKPIPTPVLFTAPTIMPSSSSPPADSAVAPVDQRKPAPSMALVPATAKPAVERARADMAQRLGVAADTIEVVGVQQLFTSSGASDSPGQASGWRIRLAAGNAAYIYQVDAHNKLRLIDPRS